MSRRLGMHKPGEDIAAYFPEGISPRHPSRMIVISTPTGAADPRLRGKFKVYGTRTARLCEGSDPYAPLAARLREERYRSELRKMHRRNQRVTMIHEADGDFEPASPYTIDFGPVEVRLARQTAALKRASKLLAGAGISMAALGRAAQYAARTGLTVAVLFKRPELESELRKMVRRPNFEAYRLPAADRPHMKFVRQAAAGQRRRSSR